MNQYHVPSPSFSEIILLFNPSLSIATHSLVHLLSAMLAHSMFTASLKHCLVTCRFAYILPSLFPWTTPNQTGYVVAQPVEWHWHHHRAPCTHGLHVHVPVHSRLPHLLPRSIICWVVVWLTHLPAFLLTKIHTWWRATHWLSCLYTSTLNLTYTYAHWINQQSHPMSWGILHLRHQEHHLDPSIPFVISCILVE